MFAQVDNVALDIIESDTDPTIRYWEDEEEETDGITIAIGNTVVTISPVSEFAHKLLEVSKPKE